MYVAKFISKMKQKTHGNIFGDADLIPVVAITHDQTALKGNWHHAAHPLRVAGRGGPDWMLPNCPKPTLEGGMPGIYWVDNHNIEVIPVNNNNEDSLSLLHNDQEAFS